MRALVVASLVLSGTALAEQPAEYVPAPASEIPGYSETVFPCKRVSGWKTVSGQIVTEELMDNEKVAFDPRGEPASNYVRCTGEPYLQSKSLRELSLLRNTILARYGWGGFRKPWLREHFQQQPWYKPDPKFSYKRLSKVDRQNVALIAQAELGLRYTDLERMRERLLVKAGSTHPGADRDALKKHLDNKPVAPDLDTLSAEERIELGLISRAMGDFALDEGKREQAAGSLDEVLKVKELRQLSLRDLRLLRNTIFARRGRPFKSELLQEHFTHMPWYTPDPAYTDERLTATDKRNIELIRQVEKEFGGALQDKDFRVDNPSGAGDVEDPSLQSLAA